MALLACFSSPSTVLLQALLGLRFRRGQRTKHTAQWRAAEWTLVLTRCASLVAMVMVMVMVATRCDLRRQCQLLKDHQRQSMERFGVPLKTPQVKVS
jgi:hypothetical protein